MQSQAREIDELKLAMRRLHVVAMGTANASAGARAGAGAGAGTAGANVLEGTDGLDGFDVVCDSPLTARFSDEVQG